MYGYIYLTKNTLNDRMYVGKHKASKYDKNYYGSGKILVQAILKSVYSYTPRNPNLKKMLEAGTKGIPIESCFRGKHKLLNGIILYYKQDKNVETMGDECNPVGDEMSTSSKCKTEIEEIVHPT